MLCPICLQNNLNSEIISLTESCYVCSSESCIFWLTGEQFNSLSQEDLDEVVSPVDDLCNQYDSALINKDRDRTDTHIVFESTNEGTENYVDQNLENNQNLCDFKELSGDDLINHCKQQTIVPQSHSKDIDSDHFINNQDEIVIIQPGTPYVAPKNSSKRNICEKDKLTNIPKKRKLICNSNSMSNLSKNPTSNQTLGVINWLKLPVLMKIESKIVSAIILHLELFNTNNSLVNVEEFKLKYLICNAFANRFHWNNLEPMFYNFVSGLIDMYKSIQLTTISSLQIDSSIINILRQYFDKCDPKGLNKCQFQTTLSCEKCQTNMQNTGSDYFLSLPYEKTYFRMTRKNFTYSLRCEKCDQNVHHKIELVKLPKFLVIHCPKGIKCTINQFKNEMRVDRKDCFLVSVIECSSVQPSTNQSEQTLSQQQFMIAMKSAVKSKISTSFQIHFRHKNGWYTMSDAGPNKCPQSSSLNISNTSQIRFLIYGHISLNLHDIQKLNIDNLIGNLKHDNNFDSNLFGLSSEHEIIDLSQNDSEGESHQPDIVNRDVSVELETLDLSQFPYDKDKDSFILTTSPHSPENVNTGESIDSDSHRRPSSIHSQSTASNFEANTESESEYKFELHSSASCEISNLPPYNSGSSDKPSLQLNYNKYNAYPISSSGVSSCSSLVDHGPLSILSQKNTPSIHSQTTASQFSSTNSELSSTSFDVLTRKQNKTIDDLIERKKLLVMFRQ